MTHLEKNLPMKAKATAAAIEGALHNEEYFHHFKPKQTELPEPSEKAEECESPMPDLSIKNDDRAQQVENEILDQLKLED